MNRIELLAPAGDLEKLKFAIEYGADAVYIGGEIFGLRASAKNFSFDEMKLGVLYAHEREKKVYLVLNIIPHNQDLHLLKGYLKDIEEIGFDAVILSDPGTLLMVKEHLPNMEIHLSTQANNTNYMSARFWYEQGVKRIVLAREMAFEEIAEIVAKAPEGCEFEAFVHGAMCISYSGRCLISNYMTGRDANKGDCAQSCRWKYYLVEATRPNEHYPIEETEEGTFFFNSKDLCMIEYMPELIRSGLLSLKIEGRMKSIYYVANIVRVYREAIDAFYRDPENYVFKPEWLREIKKASHRAFTTGFYHNRPTQDDQLYTDSSYVRGYDFTGVVKSYDETTGFAVVEQRNRMKIGDEIEIMGPNYTSFTQMITEMTDDKGNPIDVAPHAQQIIRIKMAQPVREYHILRIERKDDSFE